MPTNLTVNNRSHSNLTLEWRLPFDGGTNQTNYTIQIYDEENLCREIESHQKKYLFNPITQLFESTTLFNDFYGN